LHLILAQVGYCWLVAVNPGLFAVNPGWGQFIVAVNPGSKFPCLQVWVIIIAGSNSYGLLVHFSVSLESAFLA
jgi:hypothetical protein